MEISKIILNSVKLKKNYTILFIFILVQSMFLKRKIQLHIKYLQDFKNVILKFYNTWFFSRIFFSCYYKRNLYVYNFRMHSFNNNTPEYMYAWDEIEEGKRSQDLSTIVVKHLRGKAFKHKKNSYILMPVMTKIGTSKCF